MGGKAQGWGEFGLIGRVRAMVGTRPGVVLGIGDDTAVLEVGPGRHLLATSDSLIADVHFRIQPGRAYDIGRKAMAVNLSDIAAMGGRPTFALLSLAITPDLPSNFLHDLLRGLTDEARAYGVAIVGGDTVAARHDFSVHVTLLGEADPGQVVTRGGARPGDGIYVTHHLGASAAGLALLERERGAGPAAAGDPAAALPEPVRAAVMQAHLRPVPRLEAGAELARGIATAMIDLSDGLAGDLKHLCQQSGVGAVIYLDQLPIAEATRAVAGALGEDPVRWALSGGEDYELLFTSGALPGTGVLPRSGTPVTRVGEVLPAEEGITVEVAPGQRLPLTASGFTHF